MKFYATIIPLGTEEYPLIVAELLSEASLGYENILHKAYQTYLNESLLFIENSNIVIYNIADKNSRPELSFRVNNKFISCVKDKRVLLLELHLYVTENDKIIEKNYLFTNIYFDSYPERIELSSSSKFNIYDITTKNDINNIKETKIIPISLSAKK